MLRKRVLRPDRLRQVSPQFSWIDQRLARDGHLERCDAPALALYLLLVTVADAKGLSYYGDAPICRPFMLKPQRLDRARQDLIGVGLIAYQLPLYQALALEPSPPRELAMIDFETYRKIHDHGIRQGLSITQAAALAPVRVDSSLRSSRGHLARPWR